MKSASAIYSAKSTMKQLVASSPKVPWFSVVWGKEHHLRFSYIFWLACRKMITTKDRLCLWRLRINPVCEFCCAADEIVAHIFF